MKVQLLDNPVKLLKWNNVKFVLPQPGQIISVKCKCAACGEQSAFFLGAFHILLPNVCDKHIREESPKRSAERLVLSITHWRPFIRKGNDIYD
jgi:hypothetical protein